MLYEIKSKSKGKNPCFFIISAYRRYFTALSLNPNCSEIGRVSILPIVAKFEVDLAKCSKGKLVQIDGCFAAASLLAMSARACRALVSSGAVYPTLRDSFSNCIRQRVKKQVKGGSREGTLDLLFMSCKIHRKMNLRPYQKNYSKKN